MGTNLKSISPTLLPYNIGGSYLYNFVSNKNPYTSDNSKNTFCDWVKADNCSIYTTLPTPAPAPLPTPAPL